MIKRFTALAMGIALLAWLNPGAAADWIYTARPGDNLWNLSAEHLERGIAYSARLQQHNAIDDPKRIPPGTPIRFPVEWLKVEPATATVLETLGVNTLLARGSSQPQPLESGETLHIGDTVQTGNGASATLGFADGSRLVLYENTQISMDALSAYGRTGMVDTRLRLRGGRVESAVEPGKGPGSRFEIITPAAIASVKGTNFRIGASDDTVAVTRSEVVEGEVGVAGAGESQSVPAGFGTLTEQGKAPEPPRPLLPAPNVDALPELRERVLLEFDWPRVAGAVAYRAQLFATTKFERLLLDKVVKTARVEWNAPADGLYVLRIRAIDEAGLEGLDAVHPFELNARPVPPALLGPEDGAAMHSVIPELWWSIPQDTVSFHLQIASDETFHQLLVDDDAVTGSRFTLSEEPPPATYYWRLAVRNSSGETGPFGEPRRFRIQSVPEPVSTDAPTTDETQLRFSWGRSADTVAYEFQLAKDDTFETLVVEDTIDETAYVMDIPPGGTYYFRARGVSDEGVAGAYSPVNAVEIPSDTGYWPLIVLLPLLLLL